MKLLNFFFQWQSEQNHVEGHQLHWDHALLLTGLDLKVMTGNGKFSKKIVGLSPVSGMCDLASSCTVSEGNHFESVFVIAHELGHNLGKIQLNDSKFKFLLRKDLIKDSVY